MTDGADSWGFIYCRANKVGDLVKEIENICEGLRMRALAGEHVFIPHYFVHKQTKVVKKHVSVRETMEITRIGMIFLQGRTEDLKRFLSEHSPLIPYHLAYSIITHKPMIIPNYQMQPFMQVATTDPTRIEYIEDPASHFKGRGPYVRITSGPLKGLEGYVVRIRKSRRLVLDIGDYTIALGRILDEPYDVLPDPET